MDICVHNVESIKLKPINHKKLNDTHEYYHTRIIITNDNGVHEIDLFSKKSENLALKYK